MQNALVTRIAIFAGVALAIGLAIWLVAGRGGAASRLTSADFEAGEDFCAAFPPPVPLSFEAPPGSPFVLEPAEHALGSPDALATILFYSDLLCDACAERWPLVRALAEQSPEDVRVVFRHIPISPSGEGSAATAAEAAEVAYLLGDEAAFLDMIDVLFAGRDEWADLEGDDLVDTMADYAGELGLDEDDFAAALEEGAAEPVVSAGFDSALMAGIPDLALPVLVVNGQPYPSDQIGDVSLIASLAVVATDEARFNTAPPQVIVSDSRYMARLEMETGVAYLVLFPETAPVTVNNFAYLACQDYYDGITFHRVLPGFVAQGGDPSATGFGGPGYTIPDEWQRNPFSFDRAGLLSMAKSQAPDSASSQFFITLAPTPSLDQGFTIFGEVVEGLEAVEGLAPRDPSQPGPLPPGSGLIDVTVRRVD